MPYLITALREFTSSAMNLVFPPSCVHCSREGSLLCHICVAESTPLLKNVCRKCAEPLAKAGTCARCSTEKSPIDRLYGSFLYETPVGSAIEALKFDDVRSLGGVLGEMFDVEGLRRSDADLIVPVPLHKSRLRSRGFNQSAVLARRLAGRMDIEFRDDALVRTGERVPQSEQPTALARERAMSGAFAVKSSSVAAFADKRILLVDDVFTTGSTVKACASALKSAGASWVGVAALAVQPIGALK
ncbi:MAG TPA: ComF family protein [Dehalococcoidia bacterium]|jgi:ComF family protein|nr:ComF family protein [Dehalococcoidia bacterium]HIK89854.1 ComF family protein [Dehalococcoidia bacterium]